MQSLIDFFRRTQSSYAAPGGDADRFHDPLSTERGPDPSRHVDPVATALKERQDRNAYPELYRIGHERVTSHLNIFVLIGISLMGGYTVLKIGQRLAGSSAASPVPFS